MKLTGNTVFITGGGSGIGRGLAEAFHQLGNKVIISGRRRANLDEVVAANPGMAAIELDITDPASIERAAASLLADYPDLNVLINNAGIMQPDQAAGRIDDRLLIDTITTNLTGPIRMTSALVEHLKGKDDAVIAYTSSVLGFVPISDNGDLFRDKGCASFLCTLAAVSPEGRRGPRARNRATLGAHRSHEQPRGRASHAA